MPLMRKKDSISSSKGPKSHYEEDDNNSDDEKMGSPIFRTKRKYVQVENSKRKELIQLVEKDGITIKKAAIILKINYSTAKHIIKQHRQADFEFPLK